MKKLGLRLSAVAAFLMCYTLFIPTAVMVSDAIAAPDGAPAATAPATKALAPAPAEPAAESTAEPAAEEPAPAAEVKEEPKSDKEQKWWQALLVPILSLVGMFIAAFLAGGLLKLVKLIEKKWDVDVPDSIEKLMVEKSKWLIAWAEEKAENKLLYEDGKKTPGAEKLAQVVGELKKFADGMGYGDDWQEDKIEQLVYGVLHLNREGSAGVVGSNGNRKSKEESKPEPA